MARWWRERLVLVAVAGVTTVSVGTLAVVACSHDGGPQARAVSRRAGAVNTPSTLPTASSTLAPSRSLPETADVPTPSPPPAGPGKLAGCPPPPRPPGPPPPPPWHPAVLVPDAALPAAQPPTPWAANLEPLLGKGLWVWQFRSTEGGNVTAIVRRAANAGLRQLWVRIGDSQNGFYGADELDALVGPAHAAGLAVIGWGFPYLYDPLGDAAWSVQALNWRSQDGDELDGFSADIEKNTEGVALSEQRAAVYLSTVRHTVVDRLIVATVYRPVDTNWVGAYPYAAMAQYVDAFAPMIYWGCDDPGADATQALQRLATLRPVHLIGQAYNMGPYGGRDAAPSAAETQWFLEVGRRGGALGASFWDWQSMDDIEWRALGSFSWAG